MKNARFLLWLAAVACGCGLINAKSLSYPYAFDAQQFMAKLADDSVKQTVPSVPCDPAANQNACTVAQSQIPPGGSTTISCDATAKQCFATADLHLLYPVDLSQQHLPPDVVQYGADSVTIDKVAYWIVTNTINIDIPPIDLYVASAAAKDEHDASAVKIGSVAGLPMRSNSCVDAQDTAGDPAATGGVRVCDVALTDAGKTALAGFVKNYKTQFQFIAHTTVVAKPGDPVPAGSIDFFVRPTARFYILK